ncbi:MAG: MATE family efflux transporter, partial [Gammaproteobacteria bacterium]|nr:MATE family efflux transporter [Gammaproteobacteria bacterium]
MKYQDPKNNSRFRLEAKSLTGLAGPLILHNLAYMGMHFADVLMAGRVSATDLAAVSVGMNAYLPVYLFMFGLLMAVSPTASQLFGAERYREIGHYARQGVWLALGVGVAGFFVIRNVTPLLHAIGIEAEVIAIADGYLHAVSWGIPASTIYYVLRFTSEAISHTRVLLYIASVGLTVNVIGNYIFMFGKLGFPAMGAVGCGVATAIVMWTMLAAMLLYVKRRAVYFHLEIFSI